MPQARQLIVRVRVGCDMIFIANTFKPVLRNMLLGGLFYGRLMDMRQGIHCASGMGASRQSAVI